MPFAVRNTVSCEAKGGLLHSNMPPFTTQYAAYYRAEKRCPACKRLLLQIKTAVYGL